MVIDRKFLWPRIAVEGMTIVASILLAFAIDAWWGDRQQREAEQVVLHSLLDDLQAKQVLLADMNQYYRAIYDSAVKLLRIASGSEQEPSEDTLDRLIVDTWWVGSEALWDSAPMNQLVAGGDLSLISSSALVQELASLQVAIERVKFHYRNDANFHETVMTPFLISNVNMAQLDSGMLHRPGHPAIVATFPELGFARTYHSTELLSNVTFQNILVAKMERCTDILDTGHPGVEKQLKVVIRLLEQEVDK